MAPGLITLRWYFRAGSDDQPDRQNHGPHCCKDALMGWEDDLEAKHGLPLDQIVGHVYVLHYETPQVVKSVSDDYAGAEPARDREGWLSETPIRHYVGWTQQANPRRRIHRHGPAAHREIVYLEPGTLHDERAMKRNGSCPKCGESLAASLAVRP